ncbi:hypothetical protein BVRB_9g225910 [Beta vulgaris subsp. vulgaris]|uniref:Uncharacterized protein n=1 Tax=Beta vulgaris subsp. vulgaris TaxID=3555 RepID=A0A0J8B548_BETVV|nr:hypothetical protein BVRB_9g225910 [Beta vulgaris subsp. vulgaris]
MGGRASVVRCVNLRREFAIRLNRFLSSWPSSAVR